MLARLGERERERERAKKRENISVIERKKLLQEKWTSQKENRS